MSGKTFKIYNTMSRSIEEFKPLLQEWKKDFVWIYSCGPTVYSDPHIGNLRAYVFADILRNTIKNILWYPVRHVVNITDVGHLTDDADAGEDKIEKAAQKEKLSAWDIARKYEENFKKYLSMLNIQSFDVFPRATEHIPEQIDLVKKLEEKGYTYRTSDGIYMDTSKVEDYGKLARLKIEDLKAGARVDLGEKKNPTDFALWKFSPKDQKRQMERNSPWGVGFPGWHIECSAMSCKYLWDQFDIHTWGVDHIPVHHTNEIAQSECWLWVKPWVKYWMHVQFLTFKWEKASKSKWNVVTLPEVVAKGFSPLDLRYLFLTAHYRSFLDFTWDILESAKKGREKLVKKITDNVGKITEDGNKITEDNERLQKINLEFIRKLFANVDFDQKLKNELESYILNDLDTPKVIARLHQILSDLWKSQNRNQILSVLKTIDWIDQAVLKLDLLQSAIDLLRKESQIQVPEEILQLAEQRWKAKKEKNWSLADSIRQQIQSQWYKVIDLPDGYKIVKI